MSSEVGFLGRHFACFCIQPGLRWLRLRSMRKEKLIPVQLLGGRAISGKQPSWLVTLKGVTSPEQVVFSFSFRIILIYWHSDLSSVSRSW